MKTIMIVDDEKKIRSIYGKMFCKEGYNVFKAENIEKAHELLMKSHVDLVLLDINMPNDESLFFCKIIEEFFNKTKVIVASDYPVEDKQIFIQGAMDYYDKSDNIQELIQKAADLFNYQKSSIEKCEARKQA